MCLPRPRGDGPTAAGVLVAKAESPPPTRGWSRDCLRPGGRQGVSPAHAGMVPRPPASWWRRLSLPRPRGDGPEIASDPAAAKGSPPPTRGWSPDGKVARRQARVSPAHAGMVLSARRRPVTDNRLPRPRGDGPGPPLIRYGLGKSPPPTRGWSLISPELRSADRVFPAHAGMVPFGNIALATGQVLEGRRKM